MTAEAQNQELPLRLGSPEHFARVESLLRTSGFEEPAICRILKIHSLSHLGAVNPEQADLSAANSEVLASLIRLFLFLEAVKCEDIESVIEPSALRSLLALDVLRTGADAGIETYHSSVLLCPVEGFFVASDRHKSAGGSPFTPPPDAVFPAAFIGTLRFLRVISKAPARDVLDLCSGSGIGALVLSKCAQHATACDITLRATHFAKFNRLLNRCYNIEVEQGDLYSAVEGRTFDRIVAHPPYVPSLSTQQVYRDGGETGEKLVRQIIEGLPRYLNPGGSFYCVCAGWDTHDGLFEGRTRRWLAESQGEFDVVFACNNDMSPEELAMQLVKQAHSDDASEIPRWDKVFSEAGVERLVYGAIVIHRRAQPEKSVPPVEPLTLRLRLSTITDGSCFEWAMRWYRWRAHQEATGELTSEISAAKPRFGSHLQVKVTYSVQEGTLVAADVVLESEGPFLAATRVDLWVLPVLANFNGDRTVEQVYETASERSMLPEPLGLHDFTTLIANMIERGYLEIDSANDIAG